MKLKKSVKDNKTENDMTVTETRVSAIYGDMARTISFFPFLLCGMVISYVGNTERGEAEYMLNILT